MRDADSFGVWISRSQLSRGEVLNIARTRGEQGTASIYFGPQANGEWRKLATWIYVTDDENSPIQPNWQLSRDGNILCDNAAKHAQWAFDLSSQKLIHRDLKDDKTLAEFDSQLTHLLAKHGALQPVKIQTHRASSWKWGDTEAKQLLREEPIQANEP